MAFRRSKDFMNSFRRSKELPMLPSYEILPNPKAEKSCVHVGDLSRASTWESECSAPSRTGTWKQPDDVNVFIREMSRSSTEKTETPEILAKARRGRRSWAWAIISQTIGVLWLVPIVTLSILNFKNYEIGASVWCPRSRCSSDFMSRHISQAMAKADQLDHKDHEVLGALQFVSKALEVWFMFISTSLIYDVAMLFAKKGGGIPVGFLLTHLEFGDIRYILNPLLWTSPIPHPSGTRKRKITGKLYLFVALAASLTILTNLMGPAVAVLIIPTLQWVETEHWPDALFNGTDATFGPSLTETFPGCSYDDYENFTYSCTYKSYGSSMDAYATYIEPIADQASWKNSLVKALPMLSQEAEVQYALNDSFDGNMIWVPSRPSLRDLSFDIFALENGFVKGSELYDEQDPDIWRYNKSLQTVLHREGLSFGFTSSCYLGNKTTFKVDMSNVTDDREVVCFSGWTPSETYSHSVWQWNDYGPYSKCFMLGYEWPNSFNDHATYFLGDSSPTHEQASVTQFASSKSVYFITTDNLGSEIARCLTSSPKSRCNWEDIWAAPQPSEFQNRTTNSFVTEYKAKNLGTSNERRWCDSQVYLKFPTYTYNTNRISNPLSLVQMNNLTNALPTDEPQAISVAWMLAAWSVDDGGTVAKNRPIVQGMLKTLPATYIPEPKSNEWRKLNGYVEAFKLLHDYTLAQALSFVTPILTDPANATGAAIYPGDITFNVYSTLHVWAYGLSDQTSKLGVAVAFLGCICVLVRLMLAIIYKFRHEHSSVELFVAALNHKPQGEFAGLDDEQELAKVRYEMTEDEEGKPMFVPEKRQNSWESSQSKSGHWGQDLKR